jgi:dTDP-4-amino-4,6-dideoxygalactose transaminase
MEPIRNLASEYGIPVVEDAAQALGADQGGVPVGALADFGAFSFQAIKHITTGDGGMLSVADKSLVDLATRMRWFGIDRRAKQSGVWENDITEVGYKYQMTDLAASLGLAGLEDLFMILEKRRRLFQKYVVELAEQPRVQVVGAEAFMRNPESHAAWLMTILVDGSLDALRAKLRESGIESNPVHYRNDRYSVFRNLAEGQTPQMDKIDGRYLCLPLHMEMDEDDVIRVSRLICEGW